MLPPKYIIVSKARAKDATKLYKAIEAKLGAQRRFVLWWDGQEKRRGTGLPSQTTDGRTAQDFGLDRDTIHRWRKRLKDPRIRNASAATLDMTPLDTNS